jgi:hypothetical protein
MRTSRLLVPGPAPSIRDFYVDESGNSGDLVNAGAALDFGQQPVFVLAGIGVDDGEALATELGRLRTRHRIQSRELKFSKFKNKPSFIADLIAYLRHCGCPIFVEVVDKYFFICATMVNHFVIPPVAGDFDRRIDVIRMKSEVAEYLHAAMPLAVTRAYIAACITPSVLLTRLAFEKLLGWLQSRIPDDPVAAFVHQFAADSFADFEKGAASRHPDPRAFLPVPDLSKAAKSYWILPNLSSFTNLYARINLFRRKDLHGVRIIHDEQLQYGHILDEGKRTSEEFAEQGLTWPLPHADYGFTQRACLTFATSHTSAGIQAADMIAGFVMRYVQAINSGDKLPSPESVRIFQSLLEFAEPEHGTGFNFVVSHGDFARLGLLRR